MIRLIEPEAAYLPSYIDAYDEYAAHHVTTFSFRNARVVDVLQQFDDAKHARNLPPNRVAETFYWLVDDDTRTYIGQISIRHQLTPALLRYGGHIGYGVRYSAWNRGLGTRMLALALEKAREMGLSRVLITCDEENIGSARVMEKNGFTLSDRIENKIDGQTVLTRRYWKTL